MIPETAESVRKNLTFDYLVSKEVKEKLGEITVASATDGNHGRGIAWAAGKLGHKCVIYVHSKLLGQVFRPFVITGHR